MSKDCEALPSTSESWVYIVMTHLSAPATGPCLNNFGDTLSEKNRLGAAISAVRPRIEAHIGWLEQELTDSDKGLRETLRQSPV